MTSDHEPLGRRLDPASAGGESRQPHVHRSGTVVAAARLVNALFFVLTATYCILTYSSFAYQQFIRPRVVASVAGFAVFHAQWHWLLLAVTAMTLVPELTRGRARSMAWVYLLAMTMLGMLVSTRPVLPSVENDLRGLWLACAFLLPPIWLAVYDHLATWPNFAPGVIHPRRFLVTAVASALAIWILNVACVPFRSAELGDFTASTLGIAFGVTTSLAAHLAVCLTLGAVIALALLMARRSSTDPRVQFLVFGLSGVLVATLAIRALVFTPLAFSGAAAWWLAFELALLLVTTWSGMAMRIQASRADDASAFDVWTSPVPGSRNVRGASLGLIIIPIALWCSLRAVERVDWNFLVQNLCVVMAWLLICAFVHRLAPLLASRTVAAPTCVTMTAVVLVAVSAGVGNGLSASSTGASTGTTRHRFVAEFALDGYATLDPTYHLIRQTLRVESPGDRAFFAYLRANSLIEHVDVKPIDIDVVHALTPRPTRPPHIFLFAIDSLRRDYLSPYNPKVTFTPAIERFARQEFTFERAFTRYGGTGLSMPAIWAGSMLLHKEYVLPFARMNALEKLLLANGYHLAMGKGDPITEQLVSPHLPLELIDQGKADGEIEFCGTLEELEGKLNAGLAERQPLMVHTRPMNLHVSKLTQRSGEADPAFGAFHPAAAAAVRRIDGCFGRFVEFLQQKGLYDDSIVILTSDHGDSLGEAKRWGHSSTIFPEIVRVPLLVHIPSRLRAHFTADLDAASYSTDITPSIYALLGYPVEPLAWPQGRSLFVEPGTDTSWRRREPAFIASSYGPVYGVLRDNGRELYIVDALNGRDYAYDMTDLHPERIGVTTRARDANRALIREKLAALASLYHFTPAN